MKKLAFVLFFCVLVPIFAKADGTGSLKVFVNGKSIGASAVERNGVAYVPVVSLALALKINILWNPVNEEIVVNGKPLSSAAFLEKGALYVPVEAIAKGIGAPVEWDGKEHAIRIQAKLASSEETAVESTPDDSNPPSPEQPPPTESKNNQEGFYMPRTSANADFSVTVTNVEHSHLVKDYYKPKEGKKFVVVHVSEQNISDQIQMYTGRFTLEDQDHSSYEYLDGLSNFFLQILRPGGINFGTLVFEIPEDAVPGDLILNSYGNPPLRVSLQ